MTETDLNFPLYQALRALNVPEADARAAARLPSSDPTPHVTQDEMHAAISSMRANLRRQSFLIAIPTIALTIGLVLTVHSVNNVTDMLVRLTDAISNFRSTETGLKAVQTSKTAATLEPDEDWLQPAADTAPSRASASDPEVLPSGICQAPSYEPYVDSARPRPGRPTPSLSGAEQWDRAFGAVMARCRKGDVLELTHDAQRNALRLCDWDRPVHFLTPRGVVCTYAGGVRETR